MKMTLLNASSSWIACKYGYVIDKELLETIFDDIDDVLHESDFPALKSAIATRPH